MAHSTDVTPHVLARRRVAASTLAHLAAGALLLSSFCCLAADERGGALERWKHQLIESLLKAGDADSLLAVSLIDDQSADQAQALSARMVAAGKSNAKVLWTAAMSAVCDTSSEGSNSRCDRSLRAAKALTQADGANAMAWLTLAYADNRAHIDDHDVDSALARAASAPRVHDYGFDLLKVVVTSTARVPVPVESLPASGRTLSTEEVRLNSLRPEALLAMRAAAPVVEWLGRGCTTGAMPTAERARLCASAKEVLKRGDSQLTLSGDPNAIREIRGNLTIVQAKKEQAESAAGSGGTSDYAKAMVESYAAASSEREFWKLLAGRLGPSYDR